MPIAAEPKASEVGLTWISGAGAMVSVIGTWSWGAVGSLESRASAPVSVPVAVGVQAMVRSAVAPGASVPPVTEPVRANSGEVAAVSAGAGRKLSGAWPWLSSLTLRLVATPMAPVPKLMPGSTGGVAVRLEQVLGLTVPVLVSTQYWSAGATAVPPVTGRVMTPFCGLLESISTAPAAGCAAAGSQVT